MKRFSAIIVLSLWYTSSVHSLSISSSSFDRRQAVKGILSTSTGVLISSDPVLALEGKGGTVTRVEGIGGGFDITSSKTEPGKDVIYPASMAGIWNVRRVVTSIEGDNGQAELAWRNLGGTGSIKDIESFQTQFIVPPSSLGIENQYVFDGETFQGCVLDRGFEIASRKKCKSTWSIDNPDVLLYDKDGSEVEIAAVQRKIELPSEKGFGYSELYRVTSSAGGIFGDSKVQRAVKVQRRYRRALDENGNRIVEGLEIQKTFRVLDGVAGIEMPTSTMKSSLKFREK